jgi:Arc/MetJ family transcription regulator
MSIRKTSVAIDEGLLERARLALGTTTLRQTIEVAFLEVLRARARHDEVAALSQMRGMDLDDPELMRRAWDRTA